MSPDEIERLKQLARDNGLMPELLGEDVQTVLNSTRPKIRLIGDQRELIHFAQEVGEVLRSKNLFRRDRTPVVVNHEKIRLDSMTPQALRSWAQRHIVFFKDKSMGEGDDKATITIVKTMNVDTARGLLESWEFLDYLPEIERLNPTRMPALLNDGRIELMPVGYFPEQRIYTMRDTAVIDETMTPAEANAFFDDLLSEFCFNDAGRSKAVVIASAMTMFGGGLLPHRALRPGFVLTANSPGAGKTLAAKIAIIPVAKSAAPRSMPRKEEMKKVLDVIAMDAATYVLFDNIKGTIGGEEIEAFITAPEWEGRVLGESTKFRVDNVATCFFTGNESKPTQDMQERCLFVELFVEEADNRDRKIKRVIDDTFLASDACRGKMLSAMWAMVRAWDAAGRPLPPTRLPRFEAWADTIAGIVAHAGYGDACARPDIASASGEVAEMRKLVLRLAPADDVAQKVWTFADIMAEVKTHGLFESMELRGKKGESEDMFDGEGDLSPAARSFFGRFLVKFDQRLFTGDGGARWRFVAEGKGNSRRYLVKRETAT